MLRHCAVAGLLIEVLATAPLSAQHANVPLQQWDASRIPVESAVQGTGAERDTVLVPPKPPPAKLLRPNSASVPDSLRQRVGYQHWRGGALGLTIGAALGVATGAIFMNGRCDDCSDQPSGALTGGLIGAGAGGLLGFFAGLASPKYRPIPVSNSEP
jgi:hypothetical protein